MKLHTGNRVGRVYVGTSTISVLASDCGARYFVRRLVVTDAQGLGLPSASDFRRQDVRLVTKTAMPVAPLRNLTLHLEVNAHVRRGGVQRQALRTRTNMDWFVH